MGWTCRPTCRRSASRWPWPRCTTAWYSRRGRVWCARADTREIARSLAFASGALAWRHRRRNAATLTVAMCHRVVEPGTPCDPIYSLPAALFAACLGFLRRHYSIVSLADLAGKLPPCALLLTFDDGWRDTATVALPLLRAAGVPATVFVATDALLDPAPWWQDALLGALRERRAGLSDLWQAAGPADAPPAETPELPLLCRYAALDPAERTRLLAPYASIAGAMLDQADLPRLAGMAIGGHGAAHLPLTMIDADEDLRRCRDTLGDGLALSFPHGRYDQAAIAAARSTGFAPLFTSDAILNAAPNGRAPAVLGRISLQADAFARPDGTLDEARLATWLFHRPIRALP